MEKKTKTELIEMIRQRDAIIENLEIEARNDREEIERLEDEWEEARLEAEGNLYRCDTLITIIDKLAKVLDDLD